MNIAVQSPNWIGDCVMCIPALRALKFYYPDRSLHLICRRHLRDIFSHIREIDQIIPVTDTGGIRGITGACRTIRPYHFKQGILFTNSFRSALIFRLAGINNLLGYRKDLRGILLSEKLNIPRNREHHTHYYTRLIDHLLGVDPDHKPVTGRQFSGELVVNNQEKRRLAEKLAGIGIDAGKPLIGISPSAAYGSAKEWLPERFSELIRMLAGRNHGCQVLLFGSEREATRVSDIRGKSGAGVFDLSGKLSLREAIVAISLCRLFISNDSGLMHVAASLNVPVIGLFGPTVPDKTAPRHPGSRVIYHRVDCAPCLHRECPLDHRCMTAITVDEVQQMAVDLLKDSSGFQPAGRRTRAEEKKE